MQKSARLVTRLRRRSGDRRRAQGPRRPSSAPTSPTRRPSPQPRSTMAAPGPAGAVRSRRGGWDSWDGPGRGVSKSVAKAPRAGIGRGRKRGISTILFRRPGAIRAFATDLDVENVSACPAGACDPEFDWRPRGSALVAVLSASRPAGDPPAPVGAPRDLIRARGSPVNVLIRWAPTGAPTTRKAHHHDDGHRRDAHPGPTPATSRGSSRGSTPTRTPTTSRPAARRPARGRATCGSRRPRRATTSPATSSAPTGAFG